MRSHGTWLLLFVLMGCEGRARLLPGTPVIGCGDSSQRELGWKQWSWRVGRTPHRALTRAGFPSEAIVSWDPGTETPALYEELTAASTFRVEPDTRYDPMMVAPGHVTDHCPGMYPFFVLPVRWSAEAPSTGPVVDATVPLYATGARDDHLAWFATGETGAPAPSWDPHALEAPAGWEDLVREDHPDLDPLAIALDLSAHPGNGGRLVFEIVAFDESAGEDVLLQVATGRVEHFD